MRSYSQAAQDKFALAMCGGTIMGTFLDIGCNDWLFHNNTLALEQRGWTGLCVDISPFDYTKRKTPFIQADARKLIPQVDEYMESQGRIINYLSMDADDATLEALGWIIPRCSFDCITVEHDVYRIGPDTQDKIYELLRADGYGRIIKDVRAPFVEGMPWSDQPFEDWYCK